ncbi:ROK family transcriptional regulator [Virgibacillus sp. LDC-1]|uniref:ROK family transcriptional regulator n=1 Tax=Virgibacillus sp. LDC-1 TaxID=3039856 RepID=UPI0024DEF7BE|nr:ROK family transcriptional regulator [Virgibacillus sp. LDC-1]
MQKGNAAYIKNMNKEMILQCVIDEQSTSRAMIAKKLNLSKPTVSALVNQLIEEDWIHEMGNGESSTTGGRKPVNLKFNPKKAYVIGIDIGGTKVASGITDLNGEICSYRVFSTQEHMKQDRLFEKIRDQIEEMKAELDIDDKLILGMGVGIPGVTNVETGIVHEAPALKWKRFPVRQKLSEIFPYPIFVDNDVNISVLGEHWKGVGKKKNNLIYIAIGTGIGSGIMINGELYRGSNYGAGEIGYMVTDREYANSYHPVYDGYGFLESVAGGTSIGDAMTSRLGKEITAKEAFELYRAKHPIAIEVIDAAIENLSLGIANYISLLDPEIVILGGGVSEAYSLIEQKMKHIIERFTPRNCDVVRTTFGREAGVIGAVALFLKEYDSIFNI